jgi:hypothetical protein
MPRRYPRRKQGSNKKTALPIINNRYLITEDGQIADFGEMDNLLPIVEL